MTLIGAVSGNMNFRHQIRNPVTIVPFSLERELERSRMPSTLVTRGIDLSFQIKNGRISPSLAARNFR